MTKAEFLSAFEEGWAARGPYVPSSVRRELAAEEAWSNYQEVMGDD